MPDKFDKKTRSRIMSKIRSKNTKPELTLKKVIKGSYLRYQPNIDGNPDFGSKKKKIAVFVDGCFWHKCPKCYAEPKSNRGYWVPKIKKNVQRDKETTRKLKKMGFRVIRIWEHEIRQKPSSALNKILIQIGP